MRVPFENRRQAGRWLAERLQSLPLKDVVVLALPRGGVPLGFEVARRLKAPLDVLVVKKIGATEQPEFAIGAAGEEGPAQWQQETVEWLKVSPAERQRLAQAVQNEVRAQVRKWRKGKPAVNVEGKTVVLVDDGLATGATMTAALQIIQRRHPARVLVAVPVAAQNAVNALQKLGAEVVVLEQPSPFHSVGQWYKDFTQLTDEEVMQLLEDQAPREHDQIRVLIPYNQVLLEGELAIPPDPRGLILFAHGSGSSRLSPRNRRVASELNKRGFASLLFDLLTPDEAAERGNVFNIPLLADRLRNATGWALDRADLRHLPMGYFGASTGAAAALQAAAGDPLIRSVVSRGGRPDLAGRDLSRIECPVLLLVGGEDHGVIELNQKAKRELKNAELVIVPGAGHLFEESGTLELVIEYAADWFSKTLHQEEPADFLRPVSSFKAHARSQLIDEIETNLQPLSKENLELLARSLADARVVFLGESSHGTEEFYRIRRQLSQLLIEHHGFSMIAVEGDWPDCQKLNRYIRIGEGGSTRAVMSTFRRWPTWLWANEQSQHLLEWMRGRPCSFYGLDVYSLYESLSVIKEHSGRLPSELRQQILEAYSCFESFNRNELKYMRILKTPQESCEAEALAVLRKLLRVRLEETSLDAEELFDTKQNAKIVRGAQRYYQALLRAESESWNIRDQHMMDTLLALLNHHGESSKAIVWAHNTHIGDYHATDMRDAGYINLGGLAREHFGPDNVKLVGFGTYQGQVVAGRAWEAKPEAMELPPARPGSVEADLHQAAEQVGLSEFYLDLSKAPALSALKGHRAVGVVYQSRFEAEGRNYVPTELSKRYDIFVFCDQTSALKVLGSEDETKGLLPETWPSGS